MPNNGGIRPYKSIYDFGVPPIIQFIILIWPSKLVLSVTGLDNNKCMCFKFKDIIIKKKSIIILFQKLAESVTEDDFTTNLQQLKESHLWKRNPRLQIYIEKQWLSKHKVDQL